jgi:sec-independent protein translocase protein TatB
MFDIGWSEMLVVVVVAVVVVGPKDLPRLMRTLGQWMGRARAMSDQFRRSFNDMARQAELEQMRAEMMKLHNEKTLAELQRETDEMLGYIPPRPTADMPSIQKPAVPETPVSAEPSEAAPAPAASERLRDEP